METKKNQEMIEKRWKKFQKMQGYSDAEIAAYRANPRYTKAMENAPKFMTHRIVVEVVESNHCNAGHKVGDKFILTANGYLVADESPKLMCIHALFTFAPYVYAMWERFYEDLDPSKLLFDLCHCPDVGCGKGGWGECIMRMYAEEIPKDKRQKMLGGA
jgi:uncharacterized repeat protein (TIGR04076 family)